MAPWLLPALVALVVWSIQRALSKAVLAKLSTAQFYLLTAVVSLPIYLPVLAFELPPLSAFAQALGVSALMAVTFGVTTEAIRRGPVGRVSPITGLSPALTAVLALAALGERVDAARGAGVAAATLAVVLLGYGPRRGQAERGWLALAVASFALQGIGAFVAKVVVTDPGPAALLVTSAAVQVAVGFALLRRRGDPFPDLRIPIMRWTVLVLALAAGATIGYLFALSVGPASAVVPLVATSPALGGLIGAIALREETRRYQYLGMALGLIGAVLLALPT